MNLLIIGPQGSGKGTQGKKLAELLGLKTVEMGHILRTQAELDNPVSREIKGLLAQGMLLPNELVNATVEQYLESMEATDGILFDAYPRQVEQWTFLRGWLEKKKTKIDGAIALDLDDETCISRLRTRVMSRSTGQIFNYQSCPPPDDWPHDDLYVREDDQPASVVRRLEQYRAITEPLLKLYEKEQILMPVDASGTIDEVFALILSDLRVRKLLDQ